MEYTQIGNARTNYLINFNFKNKTGSTVFSYYIHTYMLWKLIFVTFGEIRKICLWLSTCDIWRDLQNLFTLVIFYACHLEFHHTV